MIAIREGVPLFAVVGVGKQGVDKNRVYDVFASRQPMLRSARTARLAATDRSMSEAGMDVKIGGAGIAFRCGMDGGCGVARDILCLPKAAALHTCHTR